jgi:hypothetical protein
MLPLPLRIRQLLQHVASYPPSISLLSQFVSIYVTFTFTISIFISITISSPLSCDVLCAPTVALACARAFQGAVRKECKSDVDWVFLDAPYIVRHADFDMTGGNHTKIGREIIFEIDMHGRALLG